MKVKRNIRTSLTLKCDNPSDTFTVEPTNMGEPYREGILIGIENTNEFNKSVHVMLEDSEAKQLRNVLINRYPID